MEWVESGIEGKHVPIAHSSGTGFKPDEEMVPNSGIDPHVYGVVPSLTPSIPPAVDHKTDHALVTEGGVHPSASGSIVVPRDESSEHRHYKFSIDLRGMQNLTLTPGIKCYLRCVDIQYIGAKVFTIGRSHCIQPQKLMPLILRTISKVPKCPQ